MSSLGSRTLTQCFTAARSVAFLNDVEGDVYNDSVLLPVGAFAIGEIQDEFAMNNIPSKETITQALTYTAGDTDIDYSAITDFQQPLEIWERGDGDNVWFPMTRVLTLPAPVDPPLNMLLYWEWRNDTIAVPECSVDRELYVRYRRQLPYPTDASVDTVGGEGYYFAAVAGTAFYALGGTDRTERERTISAIYYKRLRDAITVASKDRQVISTRQMSGRGGSAPRIVVGP